MSGLKRYYVISPEYGVLVPITDDGQGPTEYGREVIEVKARTKRQAIIKGVAEARKNTRWDSYFRYAWCGDTPPWKGWRAEAEDELVEKHTGAEVTP